MKTNIMKKAINTLFLPIFCFHVWFSHRRLIMTNDKVSRLTEVLYIIHYIYYISIYFLFSLDKKVSYFWDTCFFYNLWKNIGAGAGATLAKGSRKKVFFLAVGPPIITLSDTRKKIRKKLWNVKTLSSRGGGWLGP